MSLTNIITIDGVASSGKTSVAIEIAAKIGYSVLDSGSVYRAFCYHLIENQVDIEPRDVFLAFNDFNPIITDEGRIILNDQDITDYLHLDEINDLVPFIGSAFFVRKRIREIQRSFCLEREGKVVVTGRDVGEEVFPEAKYKYFLDASPEVRALRRYLQLREIDPEANLELVLASLVVRDNQDCDREVSPMCVPEGALFIDTTELDSDEVVRQILADIREIRLCVEGTPIRGVERG